MAAPAGPGRGPDVSLNDTNPAGQDEGFPRGIAAYLVPAAVYAARFAINRAGVGGHFDVWMGDDVGQGVVTRRLFV